MPGRSGRTVVEVVQHRLAVGSAVGLHPQVAEAESGTGPPRIGSSIRSSCAAQSMSNQVAYGESRPSRSTDQSCLFSGS